MITLKTGLPRNGKTLSLVDEVATLLERWRKHPGEQRPVFQFGIDELKLEGIEPLDVWPVGGKSGDQIPRRADGKPACKLTFDQSALPDGSLVLLDEAQDFYPPRGPAQNAPAHVAELNTHGHRNLDYIVLTQHPKLIDNAVRRLVNKHQHYRRMFGGGRAITYEWDSCSDSLDFPKAVKGMFAYPKKRFGLYKSATGFTKPKFRLPAFLVVPLLAIPLAIFAGPRAWHAMYGASTGKGINGVPAFAPPASAARVSLGPVDGAQKPASPEGAASAPDTFAGCIAMGPRCSCIDDKGRIVKVAPEVCQTNVASSGHEIPYVMRSTGGSVGFAAATGLPAASAASSPMHAPVANIKGAPPEGTQRHVPAMSKSFL